MLQFHKILLGLYTLANSYCTLCVTKHGILGPEVNILQLLGDFVP